MGCLQNVELAAACLGSGVLAVAFEVGADFSPDAGYAHFLFLNGFLRLFQVGGRMFKDIQKAEQLFLGSGPVPYFPELFLLLQQLGMIVLQSFPSIFDRVWKLGKFFINNIAGTDDDKGEQPQAEVPEKSVSPGFPFGIFLPSGFFFRSVFRDDVQGGFQTFFGCGGGVFILMFSSVLLRSKAGFVFRRGEGFAGRLSGRGGVGHGMRGNGG